MAPVPHPTLTLIAQPTLPYLPIISPSTIYDLHKERHPSPKRVDGGICKFGKNEFTELNEYGIVYRKTILNTSQMEISFHDILSNINEFLKDSRDLYERCKFLGSIELKIGLREANGCKLTARDRDNRDITRDLWNAAECWSNLDTALAKRCLSHDLENKEKRIDIAEELIWKLLWIFNISTDKETVRDRFKEQIENIVK